MGSVVWARLEGGRWWPGQVAADAECPDVVESLRKPPLAIVKFFDEDFYHIVNNNLHIFPFECEKKEQFLKLGKELKVGGKDNFSLRLKFEADVSKAEEIWTSANTGKEPKKLPIPTPEKTPLQKTFSRCSYMKMAEAERFDYNVEVDEEVPPSPFEPFLRKSDELGMPRIRKQPTTPKPEDMLYNCDTCGYQTARIDNIVRHHKTHSDPYRFHPAKEFGPTFVFEKLDTSGSRKKGAKGLSRSDGKVKRNKTPRKRLIDKPFPIYRKTDSLTTPKRKSKDSETNSTPKRRRTKSKEQMPAKVPFSNPFEDDELEEERKLKEKEEAEKEKTNPDEETTKEMDNDLLDDIDDMEESQDLEKPPKPVIVEWEEFIKDSTVKPPMMSEESVDSSNETTNVKSDEGDSKKDDMYDDVCMSPVLLGDESEAEKSEKEELPSSQEKTEESDSAIEMITEESSKMITEESSEVNIEEKSKVTVDSALTSQDSALPKDSNDMIEEIADNSQFSATDKPVEDLPTASTDAPKDAESDTDQEKNDEPDDAEIIVRAEEKREDESPAVVLIKEKVEEEEKEKVDEEEKTKDDVVADFFKASDDSLIRPSESEDLDKSKNEDKMPIELDVATDDSSCGSSIASNDPVVIMRKFIPSPIKENTIESELKVPDDGNSKDGSSSPKNLVVRENSSEESVIAKDSPRPHIPEDLDPKPVAKGVEEDNLEERHLPPDSLHEIKEPVAMDVDEPEPEPTVQDVVVEMPGEVPVQEEIIQEQVEMCNVIPGDEIVLADNDMSTCEVVVGELQSNEIVVGDEIEVQEIEIADDGIQPNEIVIGEEIMIQPMEVPLVADPSDGLNNIQNNGHTIIDNPQSLLTNNQCSASNIVIDENTSIVYSSSNILDSTIISLPKTPLTSSKDIPITLTSEQQVLLSNRMTAFNKPHYANAIISDGSAQEEVTVLTTAATDNLHREKQTVFNVQQEYHADAPSLDSRSTGIATAAADFLVHQ